MRRGLFREGVRRLFRLPLRTPQAAYRDADEELDSLVAARIDDLVTHGMSIDAARVAALGRLGMSVDQARTTLHQSAEHRERRMRLSESVESIAQDVRYALRGLARRPAFTAVAVLTLAIGIGATTAIFSAVNVLLLRRLPYAAPERLMAVSLTTPANGARPARDDMVWSYPKFVVFRDAQTIFSTLSLYTPQQNTVTSGDVEQLRNEQVGAQYFRTLGLGMMRGRDFDPSIDAHAGAARQVIITDGLWQRRFDADPAIVGKTIELDHERYDIIGVSPPTFRGLTGQADLFIPITTRPAEELNEPQSHSYYLVARLATGVTPEAATAAVVALGKHVHEVINDQRMGNGAWGATARRLNDVRIAPLIRRSLLVVIGAVGFVLLIACVNVANLLIGRASVRRREIAVRLAIGAGRARLARMLLAESLVLAFAGGLASIVIAWLGVKALSAVDPATMFRVARFGGVGSVTFSLIHLDWTTLVFAFAVTLVVGVAFGLVPALSATRVSLGAAMKDAPDGASHRRALSGRRLLVATEVALAVVLLAGSGLMIRSLAKLLGVNPGFNARGVLTVRMQTGGITSDSAPAFYDQLLTRLRGVPGVADVSIGNCAPLSGGCNGTRLEIMDGRPKVDFSQMPSVGVTWTSPTWFSSLGIPVRQGRVYTTSDRLGAPKVVVISETAARRFWPNGDALGKRIGVGQGGFGDGAKIVGIVGDVRQFVDSEPKPDVYIPYLQSPRPGLMLFLRTTGDPASLATDVRRALREVAPRYPVYDIQTMAARAAAGTASTRFSAVLLGLFAATALSLAGIGLYGVMSLAVSARTREIGVRIALGADRGRVQRLVIADGAVLVGAGIVVGVAGSLAGTRVMRSLLFDLAPTDPPTYVAIIVILGACALTASWLPARRASRVDPVTALRTD